jgi:hypothetical protein
MVINDLDFDVEELSMEDFPDETQETALFVISQASLNRAGMFVVDGEAPFKGV